MARRKHHKETAVGLFYSYSHSDAIYRQTMQASLALLQRKGLIRQWSDQEILPGQSISSEIREKMDKADIMLFLLSPDFLASDACMAEWEYAQDLASQGNSLIRVPVIVRNCAWKTLLEGDDLKALPNDGVAVVQIGNEDAAWQKVFEGIESVVKRLLESFCPRDIFLREIDKIEIPSANHIRLRDLYEFLRLTYTEPNRSDLSSRTKTISTLEGLLTTQYALIHGEEKTGKTTLARFLYLSLIEESRPVLLVDLSNVGRTKDDSFLRDAYHSQFHGDYDVWVKQEDKILIADNLTGAPHLIKLVAGAADIFDSILITMSTDVLKAYFMDEKRLAQFLQMQIQPLSRSQQGSLISKRLALLDNNQAISEGRVDQIENHVNSIVVSNRIMPRYPFHVLCIMETYEEYMPSHMPLTAYGHCYHALIVSNLIRAGISEDEADVNACFNFAERLAFAIFQFREQHGIREFDLDAFVTEHQTRFISTSVINRMKRSPNGILGPEGTFRTEYMYYFFLGRFLAGHRNEGTPVIERLCEDSCKETNHLILLFTIHHTTDDAIIDDILLRTMDAFEQIPVATLDPKQTEQFGEIIQKVPKNILSADTVEKAREKERESQDEVIESGTEEQDAESYGPDNDVYRILKNNKILGQVLRTRHGILEISKIKEIIEVIADSGLRSINLILGDQEAIRGFAHLLATRYPDWDESEIKQAVQILVFVWTAAHIEQVVDKINVPRIKKLVDEVVAVKRDSSL